MQRKGRIIPQQNLLRSRPIRGKFSKHVEEEDNFLRTCMIHILLRPVTSEDALAVSGDYLPNPTEYSTASIKIPRHHRAESSSPCNIHAQGMSEQM